MPAKFRCLGEYLGEFHPLNALESLIFIAIIHSKVVMGDYL